MHQFAISDAAPHSLELSAFCAAASELVYQHEMAIKKQATAWGLHRVEYIEDSETEAFTGVCRARARQFIVFRGTSTIEDAKTDVKIRKESRDWYRARAHRGFVEAFEQVEERIIKIAKSGAAPRIVLTGHSLGAALATLCAVRLVGLDLTGVRVEALQTFGSPRVGSWRWGRWAEGLLGSRGVAVMRWVNNNDRVCRSPLGLPIPLLGFFRHLGAAQYLSERGRYWPQAGRLRVFFDRLLGRWLDVGELGLDGLKDHESGGYAGLLERLLELERDQASASL